MSAPVSAPVSARLAEFWRARQPSEQRTLKFSAVLAAAMVAYFGVYEPLVKSFRSMRGQIERQERALVEVRSLIAARQNTAATPNFVRSEASLSALVDQQVRVNGMQSGLKNISAVAPNRVRIELGGVNFDVVIAMLEQMEREHHVQVVELAIDTLGTSTVNVKATLTQ